MAAVVYKPRQGGANQQVSKFSEKQLSEIEGELSKLLHTFGYVQTSHGGYDHTQFFKGKGYMHYKPAIEELNRQAMDRVLEHGYANKHRSELDKVMINRLKGNIRPRNKRDSMGTGMIHWEKILVGKVKIKPKK